MSHETIYRSLYAQGKGGLKRELVTQSRSRHTVRKTHRKTDERRGRIKDMTPRSARPHNPADRAVPGSWEGDLILVPRCASAIGTRVERTTRFTLLAHLPGTHDAESVRKAVAAAMVDLRAHLAHSLTWDQGKEMAEHAQFSIDTNIAVYFADPHSPWVDPVSAAPGTGGRPSRYCDDQLHNRQAAYVERRRKPNGVALTKEAGEAAMSAAAMRRARANMSARKRHRATPRLARLAAGCGWWLR